MVASDPYDLPPACQPLELGNRILRRPELIFWVITTRHGLVYYFEFPGRSS
jgi:hypothetical protein